MFVERQFAGPATHALIIGVGGYDHLAGGTGRVIEDPFRFGNLGQLTSPPRSALAFAGWLRDTQHDRWKAPLGTIDVLVSSAPTERLSTGSDDVLADATMDSIQEAFDTWRRRCCSDPENVALFYFCGHGVQSAEQLLLAQDFGKSSNPFRGAFAFEPTRNAFLQSHPATQCFFVDACREVTAGVIEDLGGARADPLLVPQAYEPRRCQHDLTLQSSAPFESAYAPTAGISYFTSALITALSGGAGTTDAYGDWVIRTDGVTSCIDGLIEGVSGRRQPTAKGLGLLPTVLYRLDGAPDVELALECDPQLALPNATLFYEPAPPPAGTRTERRPPVSSAWKPRVKAGYYYVGALFANGAFGDETRNVLLLPPSSPVKLRVRSP